MLSVAILAVACGGGPGPTPSGSPVDPAATAAVVGSPDVVASPAPSAVGSAADPGLKIGVVGQVGLVSDRGWNEYALAGAKDGAAAIGAEDPVMVVPPSPDEAAALLQATVEQGETVIVATSPALQDATVAVAKANPVVWFVGVDHDPCAIAAAAPTPSAKASPAPTATATTAGDDCAAATAAISSRYILIRYAEDQAGYLAGVVAASVSKSGIIGAVANDPRCRSCIRWMQGFARGARSVDPTVQVDIGWIATSDLAGQSDDAARRFADRFIVRNRGLDVLFQADPSPDESVIEAACAAGISAIGAGVDRVLADPASKACILTTAEDRVTTSVTDTIKAIGAGAAVGGPVTFDVTDDGVGLAPFYDASDRVPADLAARITDATAALAAGRVESCPPPPDCGRVGAPIQ